VSAGPGKTLLVVATLVVVAVLGVALWVVGSPAAQREVRLDQRRIGDLVRLEQAVEEYWKQHRSLPADLATLARVPGQSLTLDDPDGRPPYAYERTGTGGYRLCATFATDTADQEARRTGTQMRWLHAAGLQCFDRRIDDTDD
jgi:hypothetical protein